MDEIEKMTLDNFLELDVKSALTRIQIANGDDATLDVINEWLLVHMGEKWTVKETI